MTREPSRKAQRSPSIATKIRMRSESSGWRRIARNMEVSRNMAAINWERWLHIASSLTTMATAIITWMVFQGWSVPAWLIGALAGSILTIITLWLSVWLRRKLSVDSFRRDPGMAVAAYTTDIIDAVRWRWTWANLHIDNPNLGDIIDLTPFCVDCDLELVSVNHVREGGMTIGVDGLGCSACGQAVRKPSHDRDFLPRIKREVRRRARRLLDGRAEVARGPGP